jgi:hypothetical protein
VSSQDVSLPVSPPARTERVLWLIAALLGWAFLEVARSVVARTAAVDAGAASAPTFWVALPILAAAFEAWVVVTALRLRRRRAAPGRVLLGDEAVSFPPLGLGSRPFTLRYDAIESVTRRGFGGGARIVLRHRRGSLSVPIAQVSERDLVKALSGHLPHLKMPPMDD